MMSTQLITLISALAFVAPFDSAVAGTCCRNYSTSYVISGDYQNWFQALINCRNAGMDLATITSKEDEENLEKYLKENNHNRGYWIGATTLGNGIFHWATTGQVMVYTKWLPGQPDNFLTERCLQWGHSNTTTNVPNTLGWNNLRCESSLSYICEKAPCCSNGNRNRESICWCNNANLNSIPELLIAN